MHLSCVYQVAYYSATLVLGNLSHLFLYTGPLNWLGWSSNPYSFHVDYIVKTVKLQFDPPLRQNVDFEIAFFDNNTLPFDYTNNNYKTMIMSAKNSLSSIGNHTSLRGGRGHSALEAAVNDKSQGPPNPFDYAPSLYLKLLNKNLGWGGNKDTLSSNPGATRIHDGSNGIWDDEDTFFLWGWSVPLVLRLTLLCLFATDLMI